MVCGLSRLHEAPEPHILLFRREKDYQEKVRAHGSDSSTARRASHRTLLKSRRPKPQALQPTRRYSSCGHAPWDWLVGCILYGCPRRGECPLVVQPRCQRRKRVPGGSCHSRARSSTTRGVRAPADHENIMPTHTTFARRSMPSTRSCALRPKANRCVALLTIDPLPDASQCKAAAGCITN